MPLFYFNSRTGDKLLPDNESEYLPDREAARSVATTSAREALLEAVKSGDVPIQVTDSEGQDRRIREFIKPAGSWQAYSRRHSV